MKYVLAVIMILSFAGVSAAWTGRDLPRGKQLVIGFSQIGSESAWRRAHTDGILKEAERRGIDLRFSNAQQMQEYQIKAVQEFIDQKVDAIILAPVVETGWTAVLKNAKKAGIPVILSDRGIRDADKNLYTTLVGPDFREEGRRAGEWLAKATKGKCKIVQIEGTTGSAPAIDRKKGFEKAISKYPGMKIIKSQSGDFRRIGGQQVMEAFIKSDKKNIQAVFAHNDDMAIGAIEALEAAGMKPGKKVKVVSIDAVKPAFRYMIDGKLNASIECSPLFASQLFDACEKAVKGEKLPKFIASKENIYDQSNAKKVVASRKY